jgi:hypothetical protein
LASESQLSGEVGAMTSQTADMLALVAVAQLGRPLMPWMKIATSSLMQAEYCVTVAVQVEGSALQPGLSAEPTPEPACVQAVSWSVQICCI